MANILKRIGQGFVKFFKSTFYVWIAVIIGVIVGLIWGTAPGVWTGFGIIGAFIVFIFGRQIWWFVSGTGDYEGRVGLLKRLYQWIFKK